jgi:hypothetical protein
VRALLALAGFFATTLVAGGVRADIAADTRTLVECLARVDPNGPAGLDHLLPVCPDLERAIVDSGLEDQLGEKWRERLGPMGLKEIDGLLQRYQASLALIGPDPAKLSTIAHGLRAPATNRSWWQKVKDWIRDLLLQPGERSNSANWLSRLLSKIGAVPRLVQQAVFYVALTALLWLATFIVWRELKIAGVGKGSRVADGRRRAQEGRAPVMDLLSLLDLDNASPWDRSVILTRLLVQTLSDAGRIHRDRSLTLRELTQRVAFDSSDQQHRFARVSLLAEQRLYGPGPSSVETGPSAAIEQTVLDGRQLYSQLAATARLAR